MQKKDKIDNIERNDKACDAEVKIDYGECVFQFGEWARESESIVGLLAWKEDNRVPSVLSV